MQKLMCTNIYLSQYFSTVVYVFNINYKSGKQQKFDIHHNIFANYSNTKNLYIHELKRTTWVNKG